MFPCQLKGKNTLHYIDGVGQKTLTTPVSYIFALNGPLFYYFILEQDIIKYKYVVIQTIYFVFTQTYQMRLNYIATLLNIFNRLISAYLPSGIHV